MSSAKAGDPGCRARRGRLGRLRRRPVSAAAGRLVPDLLPARPGEEDGRGNGGPDLEEHDFAPGVDPAVSPLPERLPQHAVDLLAGVPRREPRREAAAGLLGLDRDPAHDRLRRRRPPAVAQVHRARRREPGRPHRRGGHPGRPVAPGETISIAMDFVSRLPRVAVRTGYKGDFFFVVQWFPKIGVFQETGWNCHQFHASTEFFADFGNYDVSIDVPARFRGKVGATGRRVEERETSGRPGPLPLPAGERPRLRLDRRPRLPRPRRRLPRGGPRRRAALPASPARARRRRPSGTSAPRRPRSRATAACSAPYPYATLTIVDPPWGARGAGGMEYPTLITAGTSLERPAQHPPARGGHGPRDGPPVLLRPASPPTSSRRRGSTKASTPT